MAGVTENPNVLSYIILIHLKLSLNSHMSLTATGQYSPGASWDRLRQAHLLPLEPAAWERPPPPIPRPSQH